MRKHCASLCQLFSLPPRSASSNTNFLRLRCLGKGAGTVNIIWTCQHLSPFRPLSILVLTTRADCSCGFLTLPEQGERETGTLSLPDPVMACDSVSECLWNTHRVQGSVYLTGASAWCLPLSLRMFLFVQLVFLESGTHLAGGGCIQFLSMSKVLPVWQIIGLFYVGTPHLTVLFSSPFRSAIGILIYFLWLLCFCGIRIWECKMSVELFSVKDHWSTGKRYLTTISIVQI